MTPSRYPNERALPAPAGRSVPLPRMNTLEQHFTRRSCVTTPSAEVLCPLETVTIRSLNSFHENRERCNRMKSASTDAVKKVDR